MQTIDSVLAIAELDDSAQADLSVPDPKNASARLMDTGNCPLCYHSLSLHDASGCRGIGPTCKVCGNSPY